MRGLGSIVAVRVCLGENFMCETNCPIETVLKNIGLDIDIRLKNCSNGKWLVWDVSEWVVYERKRYARNTTIIARTDLVEVAIKWLIE